MVTYAIEHTMGRFEEQERPLLASVNITNKCNLHCAGCYWGKTERQLERPEELSLEDGNSLVASLWSKGVRQFMFLGGEPFMTETSSQNVRAWVKTVAALGGFSTVVTNGTYGLPEVGELPRTHYFISFDGGEQGMRKVRGKDIAHNNEWVFNRVSRMLQERAARSPVQQTDVMLAMTVNANNVNTIDEFIANAQAWQVGGIVFSFSTPNLSDKRTDGSYSRFYLAGEDRDAAVRKLLAVKDKLGDYVAMSRRAIEMLALDEVAEWSQNCPTTWATTSITSSGTPIERCIFGPDADCSLCGCNISTSLAALQEGDRDTLIALGRPQRMANLAIRQAAKAEATPAV